MLVSNQQPHSRCCCFPILADATATATTATLLTTGRCRFFQQAHLYILDPQLNNLADHIPY